jgi:hypothetical protein
MTAYFPVKYLHVIGAIVILGTGAGIAFFMLMAHRSRDAAFIARTAAAVVIADLLFTLTAVILQPVTGGLLMMLSSTSFAERWLSASRALCAGRAVLDSRDLHANRNARSGKRRSGNGPTAAAALFCPVSPLGVVRHSRLRLGHDHPVVDDRKAGILA